MRERQKHGMNQINIFEPLVSLNNITTKIIPLIYVELLVIVVNINALALDDVDIVEIIPYFL